MIVAVANTNSASDHSLLWGYAVEFWDRLGIWALIIGAILGVVALLLTSAYVLYRVADIAQVELAAETKSSSERIASLNQETARLAADAEASRQKIAEANARALEAQLALEKFKTPRSIPPTEMPRLVTLLSAFAGTNAALYILGDAPETNRLAQHVAGLLTQSKWDFSSWKGWRRCRYWYSC